KRPRKKNTPTRYITPAIYHQSKAGSTIGVGPVVLVSIRIYGNASTVTNCVRVQSGKSRAIKIPEIRKALWSVKKVSPCRKSLKQHQNKARTPQLFMR